MTPLEEAVARIIEPRAFQQLPEPTTPYERRMHPAAVTWLAKCKQEALENARSILALPAIVKMQGALERCADIVEHNLYHQREKVEGVVQIARAALQPLKKEAE